jgi:hypothetical protein
MSRKTVENIRAANQLYNQAIIAELGYGCLEVSLQALGAPMHFHDILQRDEKKPETILDVVERSGLNTNWIILITPQTPPQYIHDLLTDSVHHEFPNIPGVVTGYLGLEYYPGKHKPNHATAILNRDSLPRDVRLKLKKDGTFLVIDTNAGGQLLLTPQQIQNYARYVNQSGGQLVLGQIRRPRENTR